MSMSDPLKPSDHRQVESISGLAGGPSVETTGTRTPLFPYYVIAVSMGVPALLFGLLLSGSYYALVAVGQGRVDFRQLYAAGYMVRTGHAHELYDYAKQKEVQDRAVTPALYVLPFIRPAYQSLIFVPLSLLPFRSAYAAWTTLNVLFLYLSLRLLEPWIANIRRIWQLLPFALAAGYIPIGIALMQGQDSIELLLIASATLVLMQTHRMFTAGALFALGLFKFQIVLPIALLFFLWRRWRFCAGFISTATLLGCISLWLTGFGPSRVYIHSLLSIGSSSQSGSELILPVPTNLMPNLHGLVAGIASGCLSQASITAVTVSLSLVLFVWAWKTHSNPGNSGEHFAVALTASSLVSYYFFPHDATILFLPLIVVLATSFSADGAKRVSGYQALTCLLLFVSPAWFLVSPVTFYWISLSILGFLVASFHGPAQELAST
jgi:hypothetical protein